MVTIELDPDTKARVNSWLQGNYDEETKAEIHRLLREAPNEIIDAFYTTLTFGTGGLRGIMGVGTNRMNSYVIRFATQGLANYMLKQSQHNEQHSVFIGYDSRHRSKEFAEEAARVLAGNNIKAYLCPELRPTPFVSFGCRYFGCTAAIMITASHNPPEYNGYKAYWSDGGQLTPPHDKGVIDEVNKIDDIDMVKLASSDNPLIQQVGPEVDEAFLQAIDALQNYAEENREYGQQLKIIFTGLHGTGSTLVPKALRRWGFSSVSEVEEQKEPDGDFPTVSSPNPEEQAALKLGIDQLESTDGDILLATDPDADRMGVAVRHNGATVLLSGNQIACIALAHICESQKQLPERAAFVKTIVTTELFKKIAESYGRPCFDVLTGFKYIAEKIRGWEENENEIKYQYLFGGEESYGYLLGTHCRDKDAVGACCLLAEAALHAKLQGKEKGKTLIDSLYTLYRTYGVYREKLLSIKFEETKEGQERLQSALVGLRQNPPKAIGGVPVVAIEDYHTSTKTYVESGKTEAITLPKSNVILYWLADESKVVVRPSGTEPKVKLYGGGVKSASADSDDIELEKVITACDDHVSCLLDALKKLLAG